MRYYTRPQDHSVIDVPSEVYTTTEVVTTTESSQNSEEGGLQRQSTIISRQNEVYGKVAGVEQQNVMLYIFLAMLVVPVVNGK